MLKLSLSVDQALVIESTGVTVRDAGPVFNGSPLEAWTCEVIRLDHEAIELRYLSPSLGRGVFGLQANQSDSQIKIRYWVEGLPPDLVLDSFGLRFEGVENVRQFLRNGYFSWDGSYYVQPDTMSDTKEVVTRISVTLPSHHSALYFFSHEPMRDFPIQLPS